LDHIIEPIRIYKPSFTRRSAVALYSLCPRDGCEVQSSASPYICLSACSTGP